MNSEKRLSVNIARKFLIKVHQQDLIKMKELQKFPNSTFVQRQVSMVQKFQKIRETSQLQFSSNVDEMPVAVQR